MKAQAADIIAKAQFTLQDVDGDRWTADELVRYLNEAQRVFLLGRPQENAVCVTFTPEVGARQTLPDDAMLPLEVRCNTDGKMRALTRVERAVLESVARDWASGTPRDVALHYMYSPLEPRVFYLYPPVSDACRVELTYCRYPDDVPVPGGPQASDVHGETALDAKWEAALLSYVLYRAWMKDAEAAGNAQIAAGYLSAFAAVVNPPPAAG